MYYKFKPNIKFAGASRDVLKFYKNRKEVYLRLESKNAPDLKHFVHWTRPDPDFLQTNKGILETLVRNGFLEETDSMQTETDVLEGHPLYSLFQRHFSSSSSLEKSFERLKSTRLFCLDLDLDVPWAKFFEPLGINAKKINIQDLNRYSNEDLNNSLVIVFASTWNDPRLEGINLTAIEKKLNWLLVRNSYLGIFLGPYFTNEQVTNRCFICFQNRLRTNEPAESFAIENEESITFNNNYKKDIELSWAAVEVSKILAKINQDYENIVRNFSCDDNLLTEFEFYPTPLCPVCNP